ncbi:hypothetical protein Sjap_014181 [Stephania japonica]|uniref:Uncharacterized protein n=1 Tax=Stephania japonica TaxID=461633 RepID=A0AAP0IZA9_9MAGN
MATTLTTSAAAPLLHFSLQPIRPARFGPTLQFRSASLLRSVNPSRRCRGGDSRRPAAASAMFSDNLVVHDFSVAALAGAAALSLLRFWGEVAKRGFFDQAYPQAAELHCFSPCLSQFFSFSLTLCTPTLQLNHPAITITQFLSCKAVLCCVNEGLAAIMAALVPGVNIIRMLLVGSGIWKDEAVVKSMSRHGDYRELLKGPLYYAATITLACAIYWRTSPVSIAAICNLCAGDGFADIVGRRYGKQKLPYNRNKSYIGSIAMATAGFIASIWYMHFFSLFGLVHESWGTTLRFLIVSLASALVESLPISSELDDNLTVPLTSILLGSVIF